MLGNNYQKNLDSKAKDIFGLNNYQTVYVHHFQELINFKTFLCHFGHYITARPYIIYNNSLAVKGALAHRLQFRTACKIQYGRQGSQNGRWGLKSFLGILSDFC